MTPMEDSATPAAAITNIDVLDTDVYTVLASLDPSNSSGTDGIGSNILKHDAQALYVPLHHLFKLCLCHCSILSEWSVHPITPIFKAVSTTTGQSHFCVTFLRFWNGQNYWFCDCTTNFSFPIWIFATSLFPASAIYLSG